METDKMIEKLQNVANTLEGVEVAGHSNRKRLVIAVELLMQLAKELQEAKSEVKAGGETTEAE